SACIRFDRHREEKILILDRIEYPESFTKDPVPIDRKKKRGNTDIIYCNQEMISSGNSPATTQQFANRKKRRPILSTATREMIFFWNSLRPYRFFPLILFSPCPLVIVRLLTTLSSSGRPGLPINAGQRLILTTFGPHIPERYVIRVTMSGQ
ncbi:hypothetical protein CEXT_726441, partial [Caerostris extrusa]